MHLESSIHTKMDFLDDTLAVLVPIATDTLKIHNKRGPNLLISMIIDKK